MVGQMDSCSSVLFYVLQMWAWRIWLQVCIWKYLQQVLMDLYLTILIHPEVSFKGYCFTQEWLLHSSCVPVMLPAFRLQRCSWSYVCASATLPFSCWWCLHLAFLASNQLSLLLLLPLVWEPPSPIALFPNLSFIISFMLWELVMPKA